MRGDESRFRLTPALFARTEPALPFVFIPAEAGSITHRVSVVRRWERFCFPDDVGGYGPRPRHGLLRARRGRHNERVQTIYAARNFRGEEHMTRGGMVFAVAWKVRRTDYHQRRRDARGRVLAAGVHDGRQCCARGPSPVLARGGLRDSWAGDFEGRGLRHRSSTAAGDGACDLGADRGDGRGDLWIEQTRASWNLNSRRPVPRISSVAFDVLGGQAFTFGSDGRPPPSFAEAAGGFTCAGPLRWVALSASQVGLRQRSR